MTSVTYRTVHFEQPSGEAGAAPLGRARARVPHPLPAAERARLRGRIASLLKAQDAVLVAHYYVDAELQAIAEETGGRVADSLEMARFGRDHPATTLIVAGVRFMGETAKILSPDKRVLMPDLEATCSLDLGCPPDQFARFCDEHPDRTVVVYANTSAEVKARADWVVTSSVGLDIVASLHANGKRLIWAPDRHLGTYIQEQTGADMLLWQGSCVVHDEFKGLELRLLREQEPDARVLVHPESPASVIAQADLVGSTTQLIEAARTFDAERFIVATDAGILYKMREAAPTKSFVMAPTAGTGAACKSCAHCPWMAMNALDNLHAVLESGANEIGIDPRIADAARLPIERMLRFAAERGVRVHASGDAALDAPLFAHTGMA